MTLDLTKRLSPHFTLAEMIVSDTAVRRGIDNMPGPIVIRALELLCIKVLEPVREHYGRPVIVTSAYRSPRLNEVIGGSKDSQHCKGEAADFTVPGVSNLAVCQWMMSNLNYDQLIYEFGETGWVHCSYSAHRMRNMELSAVRRRGQSAYLSGIAA